MSATWERELLQELHRGRKSRNRDFGEFQSPTLRRVWKGYRRLVSLARELRRPDVESCVLSDGEGGERGIEVVLETLRYRRRVRLTPEELDFLHLEMGVSPSTVAGP